MFRRLTDLKRNEVILYFEDREIRALQGDTVAAALLLNEYSSFKNNLVSGSPRSPYCMMGACFECLVDVDQMQSLQSCQVIVKNNMQVKRHKASDLSL